jgi:hypothetical protein
LYRYRARTCDGDFLGTIRSGRGQFQYLLPSLDGNHNWDHNDLDIVLKGNSRLYGCHSAASHIALKGNSRLMGCHFGASRIVLKGSCRLMGCHSVASRIALKGSCRLDRRLALQQQDVKM